MKLESYTYNLPDDLIAEHPPKVRGNSRLLALERDTGILYDSYYKDVANFFKRGDVLIINDTRVIKARIFVHKESGAERELIVLEQHGKKDDWLTHKVLYRGKIKTGDILTVKDSNEKITVKEILGDGLAVVYSEKDLREICEHYGTVPLPPYMHRDATELDIQRYQTVFAEEKGSVAAPTASLNMTEEILETLKQKGVEIAHLTLHVGLGTFLPIRVENIEEHKMHQEYFEIPKETVEKIQTAKKEGGRIFALGTTVARTLEYTHNALFEKSLNGNSGLNNANNPDSKIIKNEGGDLRGEADIFIYPGYKFKTIDGLITNFHAPKSTVLMLASAFSGWDNLLTAYKHAIEEKYHFLSYGDSMIIF